MSYKTDLQTNNTDLQSILATINALEPNASSGSVDTCTVTIGGSTSTFYKVICSVVDATGKVTTETKTSQDFSSVSNVVCGSLFVFYQGGDYSYTMTDNITQLIDDLVDEGSYTYQIVAITAPTTANTTGTITAGSSAPV